MDNENNVLTAEPQINGDIQFEGLTEKEAREFKPLLMRLIKSYGEKDPAISDKDWLAAEYRREMSDLSEERAAEMAAETIDSIAEYNKNLASLNEACAAGKSKEAWFADKVSEASVGMSVVDYGNYLKSIDTAISNANDQMLRTVMTNNGTISQCPNLDGYIAEQHHVNDFNIKAALHKDPHRAFVEVPGPGETYGKNSFDITIRNMGKPGNPRVHQYQVKYGADAKATSQLLKDSSDPYKYNNQQLVVPLDQVEGVQAEFPGKTVRATIGGTDKVKIESSPLTKEQAKELQLKAQEQNSVPTSDWNSISTRDAALGLGKSAAQAGMQAALITTGIALAEQVFSGEELDADRTVELALKTGADSGIKAAAAGALKIGAEKGIIGIIPKGTPAGIIANIACVGIENIKILGKVFSGDLSAAEGLDHMGRTTTSMVAGLSAGATGMAIGATALSWIPIVGPVVGGLVGGMVGYMAGSKVGNAIYSGVKKVREVAKSAVKSVVGGAKRVFGSVKRALFG